MRSQPLAPAPGKARLLDRERVRSLIVDANDGIIAVAGIAEGFIGAGANTATALVAVLAGAIAGGISLAGAKFAEAAIERDAQQTAAAEQRRHIALTPEEEVDELAGQYQEKGLSLDLARRVARELSALEARATPVEAEHSIEVTDGRAKPLTAALLSGVAFAVGALIVVATILSTPRLSRLPATFAAVAISLGLTSYVLARWGEVPVARTIVRNVGVGMAAMLISFAVGSLFHL